MKELEVFYDGNIDGDPRAGLRYGGRVFQKCQIPLFYQRGGPADQLRIDFPEIFNSIGSLELARNLAADFDLLMSPNPKGGPNKLNEKSLAILCLNRENWILWCRLHNRPIPHFDDILNLGSAIPALKPFYDKIESNKKLLVSAIRDTLFKPIVMTKEEFEAPYEGKKKRFAKFSLNYSNERKCIECKSDILHPLPMLCGTAEGKTPGRTSSKIRTKGYHFDCIRKMLIDKIKTDLYVPQFVWCKHDPVCQGWTNLDFHPDRLNLLFISRVYKNFLICADCGDYVLPWKMKGVHVKECRGGPSGRIMDSHNNDHLSETVTVFRHPHNLAIAAQTAAFGASAALNMALQERLIVSDSETDSASEREDVEELEREDNAIIENLINSVTSNTDSDNDSAIDTIEHDFNDNSNHSTINHFISENSEVATTSTHIRNFEPMKSISASTTRSFVGKPLTTTITRSTFCFDIFKCVQISTLDKKNMEPLPQFSDRIFKIYCQPLIDVLSTINPKTIDARQTLDGHIRHQFSALTASLL